MARGFSVREVLARVVVANVTLIAFAAASLWQASAGLSAIDLLLGIGVVAVLLRDLARGRPAVERVE